MTDELLPESGNESLILTWLDAPLNFRSQASPIAPAFRAQRRVPLCLLLVQKSWGERATWKALHVMNWAIQSERRLSLVIGYRSARDLPDRPIVRFEPALDRALDLAVGLGYLQRLDSGSFQLTDPGREVIADVVKADVLTDERAALASIKGKLPGSEIEKILEWKTA